MASHNNFEQANRHGEELLAHIPHALSARYDRRHKRIIIDLSSKVTLSVSPTDVQGIGACPAVSARRNGTHA